MTHLLAIECSVGGNDTVKLMLLDRMGKTVGLLARSYRELSSLKLAIINAHWSQLIQVVSYEAPKGNRVNESPC